MLFRRCGDTLKGINHIGLSRRAFKAPQPRDLKAEGDCQLLVQLSTDFSAKPLVSSKRRGNFCRENYAVNLYCLDISGITTIRMVRSGLGCDIRMANDYPQVEAEN